MARPPAVAALDTGLGDDLLLAVKARPSAPFFQSPVGLGIFSMQLHRTMYAQALAEAEVTV